MYVPFIICEVLWDSWKACIQGNDPSLAHFISYIGKKLCKKMMISNRSLFWLFISNYAHWLSLCFTLLVVMHALFVLIWWDHLIFTNMHDLQVPAQFWATLLRARGDWVACSVDVSVTVKLSQGKVVGLHSTTNMEDEEVAFSLVPTLWPVWHGWPYQGYTTPANIQKL